MESLAHAHSVAARPTRPGRPRRRPACGFRRDRLRGERRRRHRGARTSVLTGHRVRAVPRRVRHPRAALSGADVRRRAVGRGRGDGARRLYLHVDHDVDPVGAFPGIIAVRVKLDVSSGRWVDVDVIDLDVPGDVRRTGRPPQARRRGRRWRSSSACSRRVAWRRSDGSSSRCTTASYRRSSSGLAPAHGARRRVRRTWRSTSVDTIVDRVRSSAV